MQIFSFIVSALTLTIWICTAVWFASDMYDDWKAGILQDKSLVNRLSEIDRRLAENSQSHQWLKEAICEASEGKAKGCDG